MTINDQSDFARRTRKGRPESNVDNLENAEGLNANFNRQKIRFNSQRRKSVGFIYPIDKENLEIEKIQKKVFFKSDFGENDIDDNNVKPINNFGTIKSDL